MNKKPRWSDEEVSILISLYESKGPAFLSKQLNRSNVAIRSKAANLGLKVSEEVNKSLRKENGKRISQLYSGAGDKNPNWKGGVSKYPYRYKVKSIAKHKDKHNARKIFSYELRMGRIKRQPCKICGDEKSEGHHEDYSKPLDVIWLCREHHIEADRNRRLKELNGGKDESTSAN
jgi:hypothetical protein